ncbi:ribonuclease E/G [Guggenheimella bovis]
METINYQTPSIHRHLTFDDGELIKASYFRKGGVEVGMVFLGRVEAYHSAMKGYFVELSIGRNGLYQSDEKLQIGSHYLFEVRKVQSGKQPLLSRRIGLVGKYVIYRPFQPTGASESLSEETRKHLLKQGYEHVFFRSECDQVSFFEVEREIEELSKIYEEMERIEKFDRKAKLLYEPRQNDPSWDDASIMEFEEEIVRFRQPFVIYDDVRIDIDETRVGLVLDVNSSSFEGDHNEANLIALEFVKKMLVVMNVGGIVLVDLIGSDIPKEVLEPLKADRRNRIVSLSELGILEISRKREGLSMFDLSRTEVLADYINYRIEKARKEGEEVHSVTVSKRYEGIEEFLQVPVDYSEVFGYFAMH